MDPHPFHGLANFPYRTVDDLQAVRRQGIASLDVQPQQATSWAMGQGGARGAAVALGIAAWIWVPILVLVAAFVTGSAWATAAIPIAILYYNLGYPAGTRPRRGPSVAIPLAIAVFLSAARSESIALAVISSAALIAWASNRVGTKIAIRGFQDFLVANPPVLATLWLRNEIRIRTADGTFMQAGTTDTNGVVKPMI